MFYTLGLINIHHYNQILAFKFCQQRLTLVAFLQYIVLPKCVLLYMLHNRCTTLIMSYTWKPFYIFNLGKLKIIIFINRGGKNKSSELAVDLWTVNFMKKKINIPMEITKRIWKNGKTKHHILFPSLHTAKGPENLPLQTTVCLRDYS